MSDVARLDGPMARVARLPLLVPLRIRDFRLVWFGESVSLLGDQFHYVALSWLVLGLTGSGLALGTVLLAASLPRGAFLLVGGALSDRFSPRTLMLWSNLVRAAVTTAIAVLVLGGRIEIWQLAAAGVLFGTVDAFFYPAMNTIVARLVPEERLSAANAALQGTQQLMNTVGPALAGFAIAIIGVGGAFAIDAASFAVAATAVWLVASTGAASPAPATSPARAVDGSELLPGAVMVSTIAEPVDADPPVAKAHGSIVASMVEGARAVMGDPVMRMLVLLSTTFNLAFTGPIVVGLPWLVQARFVGEASMLGLLFAAFGLGSVAGVVVAGTVSRSRNLGAVLFPVVTALGVAIGAIGLTPAPVVGGLLVAIGIGTGYLNVSLISWAQARTEPHLLGRTMSFLMLGSVVGAPVSLAVSGAIIDFDATALFLAAAGLIEATALAGLVGGLHRRMV